MKAMLLASIACGCVAAWRGDRTALALLASVAFTSTLRLQAVGFNPYLWLLIDVSVIAAVLGLHGRRISRRDQAILALFLPAWPLYFIGGYALYYGVTFIVMAQFFLTFPAEFARWMVKRAKGTLRYRQEWTNLDPEVVAS